MMQDTQADVDQPKRAARKKLLLDYRSRGVDALIDTMAEILSSRDRAGMSGEMQSIIDQQQQRIEILEHVLHAMGGIPPSANNQLTENIAIDAFSPLSEEGGFHKLEYDRRGNAYRWTGVNDTFTFVLGLDRKQTRRLSLTLFNFSLKNRNKVKGWIDGEPIEWVETSKSAMCTSFIFEAPARGTGDATSLIFESDRLWYTTDENPGSKDPRRLGVAFHSLVSQ